VHVDEGYQQSQLIKLMAHHYYIISLC